MTAGRSRKYLLLIDSATSGCAGGYLHALFSGLNRPGEVDVAVSYYYPWPYGLRWFFKYSELGAQSRYRLGRMRLYVRVCELVWTFARLCAFVLRHRVKVVAYALSSNLLIERWFLRALQLARVRVYLICHDVVPFALPHQDLTVMIRNRAKFYQLADRLIVHNQNSIEDLLATFGVAPDRVQEFPFPLFDLSPIRRVEMKGIPPKTRIRYLFLGHLRPEKGLDLLLETWGRFYQANPGVELVIAGNIPKGSDYAFESIERCNVRLVLRYVSDEEYVSLIQASDCVVLPYRRGTNSGVTSTVLALRRSLIVSDIPMFRNHPLIPEGSFFRSGDSADLYERLMDFASGRLLGPQGEEWERRRATYESAVVRGVQTVFVDAFEDKLARP